MRLLLTSAFLVVFLNACLSQSVSQIPSPQINPADFQEDLTQNAATWASEGIISYVLKETRSCFCPAESRGPFEVTVTDGQIVAVEFSSDSGLTGTPTNSNGLLTVEGAFEKIQDTLNRSPPVADLAVQYDAELGYITSFFVDINIRLADEEQSYTFELLKILSRNPDPPTIPIPLPYPVVTPFTKPESSILTELPAIGGDRFIKPRAVLERNRKKWGKFRPLDYVYQLQRFCFCIPEVAGPFLVTVANGKVKNVVYQGTGALKGAAFNIPTIDELFDIIDNGLQGPNKVPKVGVHYDFLIGIPRIIKFDKIPHVLHDDVIYKIRLMEGLTAYRSFG